MSEWEPFLALVADLHPTARCTECPWRSPGLEQTPDDAKYHTSVTGHETTIDRVARQVWRAQRPQEPADPPYHLVFEAEWWKVVRVADRAVQVQARDEAYARRRLDELNEGWSG